MKKKKPMIILAAIAAIVIVAIVVISQSSNWSTLSYEAVVQETVTMSDGEIRLIVERATEIYGNPLNSLHIGEETKLLDMDGNITAANKTDDGCPQFQNRGITAIRSRMSLQPPFPFCF